MPDLQAWWIPQTLPGLPEIRRARDFRLYDCRGRRYLDLYQSAGWSILGHRPDSVPAEMKRVLQQGAPAAAPSGLQRRVEQAARELFPECAAVGMYASVHEALQALGATPADTREPSLPAARAADAPGPERHGPERHGPDSESPGPHGQGAHSPGNHGPGTPPRFRLWRPYLPAATEEAPAPEPPQSGPGTRTGLAELPVLPVLPLGVWPAPVILCFPEETGLSGSASAVSPFLLAGLAQALRVLARGGVRPEQHFQPKPQRPRASPKVRARVARGEPAKHGDPPTGPAWWAFAHPFWESAGPYIYPRCAPIQYERVYEHFLSGGIVLHPRYPGPGILPRYWSHGEYRRLVELSDQAIAMIEG